MLSENPPLLDDHEGATLDPFVGVGAPPRCVRVRRPRLRRAYRMLTLRFLPRRVGRLFRFTLRARLSEPRDIHIVKITSQARWPVLCMRCP